MAFTQEVCYNKSTIIERFLCQMNNNAIILVMRYGNYLNHIYQDNKDNGEKLSAIIYDLSIAYFGFYEQAHLGASYLLVMGKRI